MSTFDTALNAYIAAFGTLPMFAGLTEDKREDAATLLSAAVEAGTEISTDDFCSKLNLERTYRSPELVDMLEDEAQKKSAQLQSFKA